MSKIAVLNGMEINVQDANSSSKEQLRFWVKSSDNVIYWVGGVAGAALFNVYYDFDISYDLTTDLLKVVVKQGSTIVINFQVIIILRSFDYPRMCLTGDPQWANSSCDCIFSDFKIELLE